VTQPEDPAERTAMTTVSSLPDHIQLEYDAVLAADQLGAAHEADAQAADGAERFVAEPPADASAADILAEWRASNTIRREAMRMTHKRGDHLIKAINIMFALE